MKFTCDKAALNAAITVVSRTVSPKSSLAFLEGIYLAAGEDLQLTGYNLETGITVRVAGEVYRRGECVMPARMFADIVRRLPDERLSFEIDDSYRVTIQSGISSFQLMASAADEYPQLPAVEPERAVSMPQNALRQMIGGTCFAVSEDHANPVYTGALIELEQNAVTMIAIDGYRLARRTYHDASANWPGTSFVVPSPALRELEKILTDTDDEVRFTVGRKHISFSIGSATLVCRLLEGKFIEWRRVIPTNCPIRMTANVALLTAAFERVGLIVNEKYKSPVRCLFTKNAVQLATTTTIAAARDGCTLAGDGGETEIGLNVRYVLDALRSVPTEEVTLELSTGLSPILLTPCTDEVDFAYMIQPVRLR